MEADTYTSRGNISLKSQTNFGDVQSQLETQTIGKQFQRLPLKVARHYRGPGHYLKQKKPAKLPAFELSIQSPKKLCKKTRSNRSVASLPKV